MLVYVSEPSYDLGRMAQLIYGGERCEFHAVCRSQRGAAIAFEVNPDACIKTLNAAIKERSI